MTRRLRHRPVGKNLLFEFVERLVASRVIELARLIGIRAKLRKQFVLPAGAPDPEVAVVRADNHRHHCLAPGREHRFWRLDGELAVEDRSGDTDDRLARL
jgi:hypothetical protein